jgi:nucleotide-binding universal stress UspA family protein
MKPPRNILVPVDFSEASDRALAYAQTMAKALGASIHVFHAIPDPHSQVWSIEATGMNLGSLLETWQADAQKRLDGLSVDTPGKRLVKIGQPFSEITRYAESQQIDLIIMGTHGRGAIEHMLLGSVAEKVVRKAPCPVLTVGESAGSD